MNNNLTSRLFRMRSIIALVSVAGVIGLAIRQPGYTSEALSILSLAIGGFFGSLSQDRSSKDDRP